MKCYIEMLIVILILCTLNACASIKPLPVILSQPQRVYETNYNIGKENEVFVGEEIVKVKDFWVKKISQNKIQALNSFKAGFQFYSFNGSEGQLFNLAGLTKLSKGEEVYVVYFPDTPQVKFCITKEGYWANKLIGDMNQVLIGSGYIEPKNTQFILVETEKIDSTRGYTNFEIIFAGISDSSINLLYREYTSEDMARPAYYQSLTYQLNSEFIRFKRMQIKILNISNESIKYMVLDDGITQAPIKWATPSDE